MRHRAWAGLLAAVLWLVLASPAKAACPSPPVCQVPAAAWSGPSGNANLWPSNPPVAPFSLTAPAPGFGTAPYLAVHGSASVAVDWLSYAQCQNGAVAYTDAFPPVFPSPAGQGPDSGTVATRNDSALQSGATRHAAMLEGLRSGTRYYYRAAVCDAGGQTLGYMDGTFSTPAPPGAVSQPVKFAVFGEFHGDSNPTVAANFTAGMRSFQPDFIVDSGDLTTHMTVESLDDYLRQSQGWSHSTFLLPTYSNHNVWVYAGTGVKFPNFFTLPDLNGCFGCATAAGCAAGDPVLFRPDICFLPSGQTDQCPSPILIEPIGHKPWYSTRYGPVEVITLAGLTTRISKCEREEQARWLAREIRNAHDPAKNPPKFVIIDSHQPLTRPDIVSSDEYFIDTVLANGGADLFLVGHLGGCVIADYSTVGGPPFVGTDGTALTSRSLLQIETDLLKCGNGTNPNEVFDVTTVPASAGGGTAPHFLAVDVNGDVLTARFAAPQWRYGLKPVTQEDNATGCFTLNKATNQLCTCSAGWHKRLPGKGAWPGGLALGPGTAQAPNCIPLPP